MTGRSASAGLAHAGYASGVSISFGTRSRFKPVGDLHRQALPHPQVASHQVDHPAQRLRLRGNA